MLMNEMPLRNGCSSRRERCFFCSTLDAICFSLYFFYTVPIALSFFLLLYNFAPIHVTAFAARKNASLSAGPVNHTTGSVCPLAGWKAAKATRIRSIHNFLPRFTVLFVWRPMRVWKSSGNLRSAVSNDGTKRTFSRCVTCSCVVCCWCHCCCCCCCWRGCGLNGCFFTPRHLPSNKWWSTSGFRG